MSAQLALALPCAAPSNCVVINARCSLHIEEDQRVIVVAGLPVHHYRAEDAVAEAYAMVFLVEAGFAQQREGRARVRPLRAHGAPLSGALRTGRDGGAETSRGLASRSTAYPRQAAAQHRAAEE